jgi:hypothetical protein
MILREFIKRTAGLPCNYTVITEDELDYCILLDKNRCEVILSDDPEETNNLPPLTIGMLRHLDYTLDGEDWYLVDAGDESLNNIKVQPLACSVLLSHNDEG